MRHSGKAAVILALAVMLCASCSEPTVIANTLGSGEESASSETAAATETTTTPETTAAFETTTTAAETTTAYIGGDGMVPNPENEKKYQVLSEKLAGTDYEIFGSTETPKTLVAATGEKNGDTCDIYVARDSGAELLLSLPRSAALTSVTVHTEDRSDFLVIYEKGAVGRGFPATVITIKDEEPLVLSKYEYDSVEWPALFYLPQADLVCMRGAGFTIGSNSVIPYHWDGEAFVPYELHKIDVTELKRLDTDNIVLNPEGAVSIYRRDNGLVHVNYIDLSEVQDPNNNPYDPPPTASSTYVYEDGRLRDYDYDGERDLRYGFFPEVLPVTDEPLPENLFSGI